MFCEMHFSCFHSKSIFRTVLWCGTLGRTLESGSTSTAASRSMTTSTLSARGKLSADTATTLAGLERNNDNDISDDDSINDIDIIRQRQHQCQRHHITMTASTTASMTATSRTATLMTATTRSTSPTTTSTLSARVRGSVANAKASTSARPTKKRDSILPLNYWLNTDELWHLDCSKSKDGRIPLRKTNIFFEQEHWFDQRQSGWLWWKRPSKMTKTTTNNVNGL